MHEFQVGDFARVLPNAHEITDVDYDPTFTPEMHTYLGHIGRVSKQSLFDSCCFVDFGKTSYNFNYKWLEPVKADYEDVASELYVAKIINERQYKETIERWGK